MHAQTPTDQPAAAPLAFGPFVLDRVGGRLLKNGQPLPLAPKPWAVLLHLAERQGTLVSKDELLDAIWGHRHVSESVLKVTINTLRSRLDDNPAAPSYIETESRRGYRFVADVRPMALGQTDGRPAATPATTPSIRPGPSVGNLPTTSAALVGRELALAQLRGLLASHPLVTLTGPGGVGKTRLALATAALDPPDGGVWLVRLEGLADATPLLDTVARALALGANASRSQEDLAQALVPLSLRIVLDNAEHLTEALVPLVALCLSLAPRVQWLVTSQVPLRISGETLMALEPLEVPPTDPMAESLAYPAAELFVTRVRAALPQFQPDDVMVRDIAELCRMLDGLPLALELAAARVPLLGTAGVLARISDRFTLLSRGTRDAPQRHRTLRSALEWSFSLLGEGDLRVLRRLSVFPGTFTPAMAQAVAGEPNADEWQVLDALQTLQEHSLLVSEPAPGEPRLRQLESVRALAAEHLRLVSEEASTGTRLAEAMRDLFKTAQARYTATPLLHWLAPLRPEADNLRQAMTHALEPMHSGAEAPADALALAFELFSHAMLFWLRSGRKREALRWFQAVMPHAQRLQAPALRAPLGLAVGAFAAFGQSLPPAEAMPWLEEAEQTYARLGDGRSAMLALYLNAALSQRVAPTQDRTPLLLRMRAHEGADWTPRERNFAAWTEAVNAHGHGDVLAFRDFCADDLARAQASDDRAEAWVAAFGLGQALWTLGSHQQATDTLARAVEDLRASGLLREYATTAALAASMRVATADGHVELRPLREAADLLRAEGMLWWMGDALMLLPAYRGDWPAALRLRDWIDDRMKTLGMQRSPVASSLREHFDLRLAQARSQPGWCEPAASPAAKLDDAEVLRLSLG